MKYRFAFLCRTLLLLFSLLAIAPAWAADVAADEPPPFLFAVEDVFAIAGRGPMVLGRVVRGEIQVGDEIEIIGLRDAKKAAVVELQKERKAAQSVSSGDACAILLRGVERQEIERGQVLAKPGSIAAHRNFRAEIHLLSADEGGRRTPISRKYRPQFIFHGVGVSGTIEDLGEVETANPGDIVQAGIALEKLVALEDGLSFSIREGGREVGTGKITQIKTGETL